MAAHIDGTHKLDSTKPNQEGSGWISGLGAHMLFFLAHVAFKMITRTCQADPLELETLQAGLISEQRSSRFPNFQIIQAK